MCGIVGTVADRNIISVLIEGLLKLEYRGYDSAGIAFLNPRLTRRRCIGRVAELATKVEGMVAHHGIAHTLWATHGAPSQRNTHPNVSGKVTVVHNGIIENFAELKSRLAAEGYRFTSDTDTHAIAHLIGHTLKATSDLFEAVRIAVAQLVGSFAIAVLREGEGRIIVARHGAPLLLGLAADGCIAASDAAVLLQVTRTMVYLDDGDIAEIARQGARIRRPDGSTIIRPPHQSSLSADEVELGPFRHFMQKEIHEQPKAMAHALKTIDGALTLSPHQFGVKSVQTIACGTGHHAGLVARYWVERLAGISRSAEVAGEYRYRQSVPNPSQLVIAISQSGETADTLAAIQHAKHLSMERTLAICNVVESAIVRECALKFLTRAGPEIGVASTRAFTTQLASMFLLAATLAKQHGRLGTEEELKFLDDLRQLPLAMQQVLVTEPGTKRWAEDFADKQHALFLGRGHHYPIALDGALNLKEVSYIHAEGYPAGELKHGHLALVDPDMPVIAVAPNDALQEIKSNLQEGRARGDELYVFANADSTVAKSEGVQIPRLPTHYGLLSPVLDAVPLQILAYHVALVKGRDVDKPRNLAKSVTVE